MADRNDIKKAKEKIDSIINLGQKIQEATPYLNLIKGNLDWYEETCNAITERENDIILPISGSLHDIQSMNYLDISAPLCSGIEASFISASAAETRDIILSSDIENHYLLDKYNDIYDPDTLLNDISVKVRLIDATLDSELDEVKNCYYHWKSGLKSNSDLAKEVRTFLEHFKGILNKLRVPKADWEKVEIPEKSWPKMVEKICKKGSENKKAFMRQQKINENLRQELTPVMKKTKSVDTKTMESLFNRSIEHVYAALNLVDENIINQ